MIQASRRVPPEQKATYHQVSGAGRSRVLRPFLGLTEAEENLIAKTVSDGIDKLVSKQQ